MKENAFGLFGPNEDLVNMTVFRLMMEKGVLSPIEKVGAYSCPWISLSESEISDELISRIKVLKRVADLSYLLHGGDRMMALNWLTEVREDISPIPTSPSSVVVFGLYDPNELINYLEVRCGIAPM